MDTDRSRDLARLERMEQELGLLRDLAWVAKRQIRVKHTYEHMSGEPCICGVCCALGAYDAFRKEHRDAT
jgi:hypothetical protein